MVSKNTVEAAVIAALLASGEPMGPTELAAAAGSTPGSVRQLLLRLEAKGVVTKGERGAYRLAGGDTAAPDPQARIGELEEEVRRLRAELEKAREPRSKKERGSRYDQTKEVRELLEGIPEEKSGHPVPEPEGAVTETVLLGVLFELLDEEGFTVDLLIRGRSKRITRSLLRRVVAASEEPASPPSEMKENQKP